MRFKCFVCFMAGPVQFTLKLDSTGKKKNFCRFKFFYDNSEGIYRVIIETHVTVDEALSVHGGACRPPFHSQPFYAYTQLPI